MLKCFRCKIFTALNFRGPDHQQKLWTCWVHCKIIFSVLNFCGFRKEQNFLRLRDTVRRVWFPVKLQPAVAPAPLVSPSWKQCSMKLVILASIARAERSTTCVHAYLQRLPPHNFSCQKSDLAREIQCHRLRLRCAVTTSSNWRKLFCLAFSVREKSGN